MTLAAVLPFGAGEVTEVRFPFASYALVVTFPSGSVTVSTSPKLLYVYDVVAHRADPGGVVIAHWLLIDFECAFSTAHARQR